MLVGRAGRRSVGHEERRGGTREVRAGAPSRAPLPVIRVANAPCSWGVLEFDVAAVRVPPAQMLQEMQASGYAGTELGDWGFLPTDGGVLAETLARHRF